MEAKQIAISPLDILILMKIISLGDKDWYQMDVAESLEISQSEVSKSLKRLRKSWLLAPSKETRVMKENVLDFLCHGVRFVFPQWPGAIVRGMPTAHSAPVLSDDIISSEPYVWPSATGKLRGQSLVPLYPTVPKACKNDPKLYDLLALIDSIRVGNARERELANIKLEDRILHGEYHNQQSLS